MLCKKVSENSVQNYEKKSQLSFLRGIISC